MKKPFYITTTLPYVNSAPHLGHALEFVRADVIARYKKLTGFDVFFNTGTDEHGIKILKKAEEENKTPEEFVKFYSDIFRDLTKKLGMLPEINFIRTTDEQHIKSAQEFWRICEKNGYIYKKNYKTKYCVGCELEKTESELVNNCCPDHLNLPIEIIDEENYFFKFSAFQEKLLEFYDKNPEFVIPNFRFNEIKSFVKRGLSDFSISRLKEKMKWGIEVPNDPSQVMYVWFDALVNYISAIGWPDNMESFNKWQIETGGMVQYCGKDNLRQQSAIWQAMLMAAGLPNSKNIIINGFVTAEGGIKMSKSLGNVASPTEIIDEYGTEAFRYYVLREVSPFEDSPFSQKLFKDSYNANLANGLGNLTSRILKMSSTYGVNAPESFEIFWNEDTKIESLENYNIKEYADEIWKEISNLDSYIQNEKPFQKIKTNEAGAKKDLEYLLINLRVIAEKLLPLLPGTAEKILTLIKENKVPEKPLFLRKE